MPKIQDGVSQTGSSYSSGPVTDRISIPEANDMFSGSLGSKQQRTTATDIDRHRKQDGALTTSGLAEQSWFL